MLRGRAITADVWKTPHSLALVSSQGERHGKGTLMKTILIGLGVGLVVIIGGFIALLGLADSNAPTPEEVRVEATDALVD